MRFSAGAIRKAVARLTINLLSIAIVLPMLASAQTGGTYYVRERFESGGPKYGFGWAFPTDGSQFRNEHLATGGYDGSGAGHLRLLAGEEQYSLGWATLGGGLAGSPSFPVGSGFYVRFRIRWDDDHRWLGGGSLQNKFLMIGESRGSTQSRMIVHNEKEHTNSGCTLGFNGGGGGARWMPRDYGLNYNSWTDPAIVGKYSSLSVKVNIEWECTPPVLVTYGVWYHVQIYVKSSQSNTGVFKIWLNNNNSASPSSEFSGFNLGTDGWDEGLVIGGFMTQSPDRDGGYRIDDVEMSTTFVNNWYPGAVPAPMPPTSLRAN